MAWAIDRLGRSLVDLLGTIQGLEACGVDLYLDQQAIDTSALLSPTRVPSTDAA
jgi:DNA invertase Pin-like site-specific DNA recombinase